MTAPEPDYASYPATELYDVFFEAGTLLGGLLNALQDAAEQAHDSEQAQAWQAERRHMRDEREAVGVDDREAQIAAIRRWRARYEELAARRA
ncbi:MAG TPA: hypothetical protein VFP72_08255 [Kineosporiaceae bacterium]|nr:hypothetical protein [Kineosporiaceae bacterium]